MEIDTQKGDKTIFSAQLQRVSTGLKLHVQACPEIEEFFRQAVQSPPQPIQKYGRGWESPSELLVYQFLNDGPAPFEMGHYELDRPAQPLIQPRLINGGQAIEPINLSLLRLAGISTGVEFSIRGVFSPQQISRIAQMLQKGTRQFYLDYLKPVGVTVQVVSRSW